MFFVSPNTLFARIMVTVGLLSVISVLIAALGIVTLHSLNLATREVERSASLARAAAKVVIHATAMNAEEFRLAGDPSEKTIKVTRERINEHLGRLRGYLADMMKVAGPQDQKAAAQVAELVNAYEREVEITFKAAERVQSDDYHVVSTSLRREADVSGELVGRLRLLAQSYSGILEERIHSAAEEAQSRFERMSLILAGMAAVGIPLGLGFGYSVARNWVIRPIRSVTEVLQRIAKGELPADIDGTQRADEVGDLARAALSFREIGLELRQSRGEHRPIKS